ncbi:hypothetical protein OR1_01374 [Geobacter sp. OR-1]|uniref:hypothetical protein n=1 Tax=Geobacter sp. OR-1 TaxID=1266765 RepID=UPI000541F172|nr:hypothetical protein [Geobacter sp. OR-1]GAM09100.1 hypothetical protein OR1_01374 [Geobacter sp. OR-1]
MIDQGGINLNLFLFSVGGVHFAIDPEQAVEMIPYEGEKDDDLFWFHEELAFGDEAVTYQAPVIVTIRTGDPRPYRVIIDSMEDIAGFCTDDIRPFPELLEPFTLRKGLWGVVVKDGRMILLVDFVRLLRERRSDIAYS